MRIAEAWTEARNRSPPRCRGPPPAGRTMYKDHSAPTYYVGNEERSPAWRPNERAPGAPKVECALLTKPIRHATHSGGEANPAASSPPIYPERKKARWMPPQLRVRPPEKEQSKKALPASLERISMRPPNFFSPRKKNSCAGPRRPLSRRRRAWPPHPEVSPIDEPVAPAWLIARLAANVIDLQSRLVGM